VHLLGVKLDHYGVPVHLLHHTYVGAQLHQYGVVYPLCFAFLCMGCKLLV